MNLHASCLLPVGPRRRRTDDSKCGAIDATCSSCRSDSLVSSCKPPTSRTLSSCSCINKFVSMARRACGCRNRCVLSTATTATTRCDGKRGVSPVDITMFIACASKAVRPKTHVATVDAQPCANRGVTCANATTTLRATRQTIVRTNFDFATTRRSSLARVELAFDEFETSVLDATLWT